MRQIFTFCGILRPEPGQKSSCDLIEHAEQMLPAGFAREDGVGLHYVGTDLYEAVTVAPGEQVWWVEPAANGGFRERSIEARQIKLEASGWSRAADMAEDGRPNANQCRRSQATLRPGPLSPARDR
jgi:hypothetical protein